MEESNDEIFVLTWRIEHFSMCPQQNEEWQESPTFTVPFLKNAEWNLYLYPRNGDNVSCYIERKINAGSQMTVARIRFSFFLLSESSDKNVSKEVLVVGLRRGDTAGYQNLISRGDIFKSENRLLRNDTFTVRCYMWKNISDNFDGDANNVGMFTPETLNATCENPKDRAKTHTYSVRTRIKVRSAFVLWTIRRFSDLKQGTNLVKTVRCSADEAPLLTMTFYLEKEYTDDFVGRIEIRRNGANAPTKALFVRAKIKTLCGPKISQCVQEAEHYFGSLDATSGEEEEDVWHIFIFLKMNDMKHREYLCYTGDVLILGFEFAFSVPGEHLNFDDPSTMSSIFYSERESACSCSYDDVYEQLYTGGKFSDITIRAGYREFRVHRNILCIRSDIFSTMFESDLREKTTGTVDITDIDPDILDIMLYFMYTNKIEEVLKPDEAVALYYAADKYNVVSLKYRCCCALISSLSVSNVCKILSLADRHQDEDLMEAIFCFIYTNKNEVFHSLSWEDFTTIYPGTAASIMLKILRYLL